MFELQISANNGRYSGITEVYEVSDSLRRFVNELNGFPFGKDKVTHSCGKKDSETETDNNSTSSGGSCPSSGCLFVAVGYSGTILTSTDAENWSSVNSGTTNPLYEVEYGNGYFITTGYEGTLLASTDGNNWNWINNVNKLFDVSS